ncbi:MAG: STAS domain-containing protein [Planctomycetaceae bacterium]|nr:STAS domain-containing protein [Planctomycetaceae bacterium]
MTSIGPFFRTASEGDVFVVEICQPVGSLSDSVVLTQLDEVLDALKSSGLAKLLVDFRQTPYFGSSLLEGLRLLWNCIHAADGKMVLCNPSQVGREILEIAKFDHLWPIVNDRAAGLALLSH